MIKGNDEYPEIPICFKCGHELSVKILYRDGHVEIVARCTNPPCGDYLQYQGITVGYDEFVDESGDEIAAGAKI